MITANGTLLCVARHSRHFQSSTDFSAVLHIANVMVRALLIRFLNLKIKKMKTYFKTVNEILENEKECPFPISVIPNNMGINLCSVDAISWQKQEDGQLTSLTVHFLPNEVDKLKLSIEQAGV